MSIKILLTSAIAIVCSAVIMAQDITVQAFNYHSTTRDTIIDFPTEDNNNFEKILMYYSMRCKDGLVSTPSDRNKGCGEWDYSCNTYITDDQQVDSLKASEPTHTISGFTGNEFPYTTQPTYYYIESIQKDVTSVPGPTSMETVIGDEDLNLPATVSNHRSQILYTAEQLNAAGMGSGTLTGIKLDVASTFGLVKNLRIRMKNTTLSDLSDLSFENRGLTTVYYSDQELSTSTDHIYFFRIYNWNGTSNIIIDFSYDLADGSSPSLNASSRDNIQLISTTDVERKFLSFDRSGYVKPDQGQLDISSEITVALWANGGRDLPVNTSICEGVDQSNNRQVNIHFPWSDGSIYWDCGNDGSGYDRINKTASANDIKNGWNHWAFTKNATTGNMRIYLNGSLWHSGTGKTKNIDIESFVIGNSIALNYPYQGQIDQFSVWNKELSEADIRAWMSKYITSDHPNYSNLLLYYTFDADTGDVIEDQSPNQNNGLTHGPVLHRTYEGRNISVGLTGSIQLPNITFIQEDNPNFEFTDVIRLDSFINHANQVDEYELQGTDRVLINSSFLYRSGEMPVFDEAGNVIRTILVPTENTIDIGTIDYYRKSAMKYEIMSFVTPYGIYLDLGQEGKTWTFDVTDFGPILNGSKRINMQAGGEWQEDIDIKFVFVRGTPSRDVHSINQVWPVTHSNFNSILDQSVYEPRQLALNEQSTMFKLKAAITGHGQEGEFTSRLHSLDVNNYTERDWSVWKQCSSNPVYPQGGTWIYNRAGWCPGMATDVEEVDLTELVLPGELVDLDYNISTASGDSRYFVNVQLVSYGEPNFELDAEMADVINPSSKIEYGRFNPMCNAPRVVIKNNGETRLTSLDIIYGIDGAEQTYSWTGSLDYLETQEVELEALDLESLITDGGQFAARVSNPNGTTDIYSSNNQLTSLFDVVPVHEEDIVINFKTNNRGSETSYFVEDSDGNTIMSRSGALPANTEYRDTLRGLSGCYKMFVRDLGGDGLSFFANNDGTGYIRIKDVGEPYKVLNPDFGRSILYEFVAGDGLVSTTDPAAFADVRVYPNPGKNLYQLDLSGSVGQVSLELNDHTGKLLNRDIIRINSTTYNYTLDLSDYISGVYFIRLQGSKGIKTIKIIKME